MVAVAQLILITLVYIISFVPLTLVLNSVGALRLIVYVYYINHVSNFFIYLAVNKEFRKEVQNLVIAVMMNVRVRPKNSPPVLVLGPGNAAVAGE